MSDSYYDDLVPDIRYTDWRDRAKCVDVIFEEEHMSPAWISADSLYSERARVICAECPVRMACLYDALSDSRAEGMRGGFFFDSGRLAPDEASMLYREFKLRVKPRSRRGMYRGFASVIA